MGQAADGLRDGEGEGAGSEGRQEGSVDDRKVLSDPVGSPAPSSVLVRLLRHALLIHGDTSKRRRLL